MAGPSFPPVLPSRPPPPQPPCLSASASPQLVTPSLLLQHKGFDLIDFTVVPEVKVRRLDTYEAFTQMVQGLVDIPPRDQQFWKFEGRLNGSSRPSFAVRAPTTERATVEKVAAVVGHRGWEGAVRGGVVERSVAECSAVQGVF